MAMNPGFLLGLAGLLLLFAAGMLLLPTLFLPGVALSLGLFFFLYSLKYYMSVGLLLVASGGNGNGNGHNGNGTKNGNGGKPRLTGLRPHGNGKGRKPWAARQPFISIHLPMYNEKEVVERNLQACTSLEYENYEVIVADDSTDETTGILRRGWGAHPRVKICHRANRKGFKGGALQEALKRTEPRAEFVVVFDADFIPPPDILQQFLSYFYGADGNGSGNGNGSRNGGELHLLDERVAAVQGYQWHVLNASENWITKGIRAEFAGSYVVERPGQELTGGMKMISGSVFMIRADVLRRLGWGHSITEDWELTLRLYLEGFRILFTPFIQAPAECVSGFKQLARQRMRWAEGHTYNVKRYFWPVLRSPKLTRREKLEFLYYAPYYLQSVLFIIGTLAWFASETLLRSHLPFWTETLGWSLVFSNSFALILMNTTGLFLERGVRRNWAGLMSFLLLTFLLVPYQAYAAVKGLVEPREGGWHRTQKSGLITEVIDRFGLGPRMRRLLPKKKKRSIDLGKRLGLPAASITRHLPQPVRRWLGRTGPAFRIASSLAMGLLLLGILATQVPIVSGAPEWGLTLLLLAPVFLYLMSLVRRRRRVAWQLISLMATVTISLGMLASQVAPASAAAPYYYLHNTDTSGITTNPGKYMDTSEGTGGSTMLFDDAADEAYWYVDELWPTGDDNGYIAAGAYTLNMYFGAAPSPPQVDAVSTATTASSSVTIAHTTSGANRLMLVGVSITKDTGGGAPSVSSITYNGVPLSFVGARATSDNFGRMEIWGLAPPATGTNNVVVTFSAKPNAATVGVTTFTGVDQSTPLGTFASATGDSTDASVDVSSAAGQLVFDTLVVESVDDLDLVPGAGQTERWDLYRSKAANGGGSTEAGASTVTMSWSWSPADKWAIGAVPIRPITVSVDIQVTVSHTASDGSGATTIVGPTSLTINASTADPYALNIGSGVLQTFLSTNRRRLRVYVDVVSVSGGGSFVLDYDGSCASSKCSNLDTPDVTVPDNVLWIGAAATLIPALGRALRRRKSRAPAGNQAAQEER